MKVGKRNKLALPEGFIRLCINCAKIKTGNNIRRAT
jgi:hypothetical protein